MSNHVKRNTHKLAVEVIQNLHASGVYKRNVIPVEAINDDIGIILDELRMLQQMVQLVNLNEKKVA